MNTRKTLRTLFFSVSAGLVPVLALTHGGVPQHGGVVAEVRDIAYEPVVTPELLRLHVSDHGKPVDLSGARARITLLSGAQKQEVELLPAKDALEAQGRFAMGAGTKAVAVVTLPGRPPATARFVLR